MTWSKVCLYTNLVCCIAFSSVCVTVLVLMFTDYRGLPQYNEWQRYPCYINTMLPQLPNYYDVSINQTGQHGLCALAQTSNESGSSFCYVPPNPIVVEACSERVPLVNLVLLEDQETQVNTLLWRSQWFYWTCWITGVLACICCCWGCYSYWFRWFLFPDSNYWRCCRGNRISAFQEDALDFNDNFVINFN